MGLKVWAPLNLIEENKYLYHYTSMEKACSILFNNELWFSNLCRTNDVFEQRVKISFSALKENCKTTIQLQEMAKKITEVRNYMNNIRTRIKLLCFSSDTDFKTDEDKNAFEKLIFSLPDEFQAINVIGRGFALPRMWAQYASDNKGVCFIFDKNKIISKVKELNHCFIAEKVVYRPLYNPYILTDDEFKSAYEHISTEYYDAIKTMINDQYPYLKYDFFSKLSDWSSENEFRIILTNNNGEDTVKLKGIKGAIEGIVFGANTEPINAYLFKYLSKDFDVRKIVYEDTIIKVSSDV